MAKNFSPDMVSHKKSEKEKKKENRNSFYNSLLPNLLDAIFFSLALGKILFKEPHFATCNLVKMCTNDCCCLLILTIS